MVERLLDRTDTSGAALLGGDGLLTEIARVVLERALEAEMSEHLGSVRGDRAGQGSGNSRNGSSPMAVLTNAGAVTMAVRRDLNGGFESCLDLQERSPAHGVQRPDPLALRARG
ncbi:transposase [Streptomyces wuyuanensis]